MSNTVYKNLMPSCVLVQVSFYLTRPLLGVGRKKAGRHGKEGKAPSWACFLRESGWFPSGTGSSSCQGNLCFSINRAKFSAWMQLAKKNHVSFSYTCEKQRMGFLCHWAQRQSPRIPHLDSLWSWAGPCPELEACLANSGANSESSPTRHNLLMGTV